MGNTNAKPHPRPRNKKQVHWKAADRPAPPGKPSLISEAEGTSDVLTIRWSVPLKDGGSPVTGYLVEYRRCGSSNWVKATSQHVAYPEYTLSGLEPGWRYQFRIFAENAVGMSDSSILSEPMMMMLQKSEITAPRFLEELKDTVALENDKVEFVVHYVGQPPPKMSWFKDGFEIFSSRRTRILTENDRSILSIHQSAMSDEGEIKCTATNRAGHASSRALLTLEAPPTIRLPRQYEEGLLFELGEVIRLKVSIAGRPMPLVFWSQNGETIQNDERYEIENSDRTSVLRVGEAVRSDRGEYQIKAVNKLGEDVVSFLVTVTDKPSPPGKARVVMSLGRSVTLSWHTPHDDGGCKIGNYIIEYFRIGWNVWLKAATSRQLSTILGDLIEGSEYKFRIKAESPYGISEPSEESDTVFIPDPKRGILTPPPRSASQPREPTPNTPIAAQRKKRSQSSSRPNEYNPDAPIRPERTKTKSAPQTPDMSPRVARKDVINKHIFDRASMARELAYGSPEIKVKKVENLCPEVQQKSRSPSPLRKGRQNSPTVHVMDVKQKVPYKSRSPSPAKFDRRSKSPSPRLIDQTKSKGIENFTGSSEFMLVLYPDEHGKGARETSIMSFDLEENEIPPPLSLSAPELGAEPPIMEYLKLSASSTELLHERAMIRFYEEAAAEEAEFQRLKDRHRGERRQSNIPKIQINSKDEEDIIGLEKKHSLRRRLSAGGTLPQQVLWAQRRHSLRNSADINDMTENKLHKFAVNLDSSKIKMARALENAKYEKEDEITEENVYDEVEGTDYEEVSEDEYEDQRRFKHYNDDIHPKRDLEEEDITYHPRMMASEEPFEILTKPNKLPDPSFIPKPILKKREEEFKSIRLDPGYISRQRSKSLAAEQLHEATKMFNNLKPAGDSSPVRQRSYSLIPAGEASLPLPVMLPERRGSLTVGLGQTIAAIANISGIAAAGVVIPNTLLNKKKDQEEAKVVVEHYGDIVNTFSQRKRSVSSLYKDDKKTVNNIFSVRQVQKQVAENNCEKLNVRSFDDKMPKSPSKSSLESFSKTTSKSSLDSFSKTPSKSSLESLSSAERTEIRKNLPESRRRSSKSPTRNSSTIRTEILNTRIPIQQTRGRKASPMRKPQPAASFLRRDLSPSPRRSPSPVKRAPMMREIMTQTSNAIDPYRSQFCQTPSMSSQKQEELLAQAEIVVKNSVEYVTDLAMFGVACYLYLFSNELLAIPVLLVMVYRQLKDEVRRRLRKWILPKPNET